MIEILSGFPDNVIPVACSGHVTREDYETVLIPTIQTKLEAHQKLRIYYEIGDDLSSIDPGAVFADVKVGLEHLSHWERIAVVTNIDWIKVTLRVFSFLFPAETRIFALAERQAARDWVVSSGEFS